MTIKGFVIKEKNKDYYSMVVRWDISLVAFMEQRFIRETNCE
jgi:hypothetical protein